MTKIQMDVNERIFYSYCKALVSYAFFLERKANFILYFSLEFFEENVSSLNFTL